MLPLTQIKIYFIITWTQKKKKAWRVTWKCVYRPLGLDRFFRDRTIADYLFYSFCTRNFFRHKIRLNISSHSLLSIPRASYPSRKKYFPCWRLQIHRLQVRWPTGLTREYFGFGGRRAGWDNPSFSFVCTDICFVNPASKSEKRNR